MLFQALPLLLGLFLLVPAARGAPDDRERIEKHIEALKAELAKLELEFERMVYGTNPGPVVPTGGPVIATTPLKVGMELQVLWGGHWWRARAVHVQRDGVLIHYLGWSRTWDEFVPRNRLRRSGLPRRQ